MYRVVRLPRWKVYLYDLSRRFDIFNKINTNEITFGIKPGESWIIRNLLNNFSKGGVLNRQRAFIYDEYVKTVEQNQSRCTGTEYRIAVKLSQIKKLHLEDLIMEMATLRKFGKEVGLTFNDFKGLSEDQLINKVIGLVDPNKKYTEEFVSWYGSLPPEMFGEDEQAQAAEETTGDDDMPTQDQMLEGISDADSADALKEIYEAYPDVFKSAIKEIKKADFEKRQELMYETAEKFYTGETAEETPAAEETAGDADFTEEDIINEINTQTDINELKNLVKALPDIFPGTILRGKISIDKLKEKMLECMGATPAADEASNGDLEAKLDEWSGMEIADLKKLAKEAGCTFKPLGVKKETLIELLAEKWEESQASGGASEETEDTGINQTMINELIQAKDMDSLIAVAEELNITLSFLDKRNPKKAGEKILAAITETPPAKAEAKKPALSVVPKADKKSEKKTIFMVIEEMVIGKKSDEEIVKAVTPMFKELGKPAIWANSRIKQLIEVAKLGK